MSHELLLRDHEDGCACPLSRALRRGGSRALRRGGRATGQPQGVDPEAYPNGTSQGELVLSQAEGTPEDAQRDGHIVRARFAQSRKRVPSFVVAVSDS